MDDRFISTNNPQVGAYGLARCALCRRVLLAERVERGRCRPGNGCGAAWLIGRAGADMEFVEAIERGLAEWESKEG